MKLWIALEVSQKLDPRPKKTRPEWDAATALDFLRILAEEVEIETEVEDPEILLVGARAKQIGAEPRPAPDHLPELDPGINGFEKDEVQHFRDVDPGIEHVDGNGDVRGFGGLGKIVQQALRVLRVVVDDPRKMAVVLRVMVVETSLDELRVLVVAGEDDRFSETIASLHLVPVFHEMAEGFVDRVFIEEPTVDRGGVDPVWHL
ncbi:MAG: hypothetical protein WA771_13180, partial [Chthoniobacterales bacterium]